MIKLSAFIVTILTQEVAIKRMRSNMSKEFLAELNVLCKVHHRNVVGQSSLISQEQTRHFSLLLTVIKSWLG